MQIIHVGFLGAVVMKNVVFRHSKSNSGQGWRILFKSEDGGDISLRNVFRLPMDYASLYPREESPLNYSCLVVRI
jgi:hypothetical protein